MYGRISLVMIVMGLTLAACQMDAGAPAASRGELTEGASPAEIGGEAEIAPVESEAPAPATTACDAGVWVGDYLVGSQADLEALAGYTEVTGSLRIEESSIVHLSGPGCLATVGGDIRIFGNEALRSVSGFDGLQTVGGRILVFDNIYLGSISGFGALRDSGSLRFGSNARALVFEGLPPVLVIDGFGELYMVRGDVFMDDNHHRILGLDELEIITGGLIVHQAQGADILGMNALTTVGSLRFEEAGRVTLDGLAELERVLGDIRVDGGTRMVYLDGLGGVSFIGGSVVFDEVDMQEPLVVDFPELEHLGGDLIIKDSARVTLGAFPALEYIGGSLVVHESQVYRIVGFEELETIEGDFRLIAAPLQQLEGFGDLQRIGGNFKMELASMTVIPAFDELASIGGNLELIENYTLASMSAFDDLRSVGGNLVLFGNEELPSLGLPDLEALGGTALSIEYNTALPTCEAEALLDRLRATGFGGAATIADNGPCQ